MKKTIISLNNVDFSYKISSVNKKNSTLLKGINLDITEQSTIGLIGASGSGKSTLALITAGLLPPSAGRVYHCGTEIYTQRLGRFHRLRMAQMLFQTPYAAINPRRKIKSWLQLAARYSKQNGKELTHDQSVTLLKSVGLQEQHLFMYPSELSGGECQRICLATCLIADPKCIILDEPTTMLDNIVKKQISAIIHEIQNSTAVSLFVISHDLAYIKKLADVIYCIEHGRLIKL